MYEQDKRGFHHHARSKGNWTVGTSERVTIKKMGDWYQGQHRDVSSACRRHLTIIFHRFLARSKGLRCLHAGWGGSAWKELQLQRYTISPLSLSPTPPPPSLTHHTRTQSYMHARTYAHYLDFSASWHKLQVLYKSWVWGHIYYFHIRAQEHQAQEPIY